MKPVYLEFCGINSFSEKAEIDFGRLLEGGLFGIFGDTGSGKSTILDCIHFALYGKIERASGSVTDSINYKCDRAYVIYDFEILSEGTRKTFRVQRERRRKNNYYKAYLYEKADGKWQSDAEGPAEVDRRVEEIIGLGFDDFKKCIALPQGEFAGLVKARPSERLQLVSRLFDLEKYGDRLSAAVREKLFAARNELDMLQSRLQENAEGTEERIRAEKEGLAAAQAEQAETAKALSAAEEECLSLSRLAEDKKKYDEFARKVSLSEEKLPLFEERRKKLELFSAASKIIEKSAEKRKEGKEKELARLDAEKAENSLSLLKDKITLKKKQLEESGLQERIRALSETKGRLSAAEEDRKACRAAQEKLDECTRRYRELKDKVPEEDFEGLLKENEKALAALGADESFTEYLRRNFKDVLMSETYGEFRADLKGLGEKYPETQEDVARLTKKYSPAPSGSERSFDVAAAKLEFDRAEKARRALASEREGIEKRRRAFEDNRREMQNVVSDGKHYRERLQIAEQKIAMIKDLGTPEEVEKQIAAATKAKERAEEEIRRDEEKTAALTGEAAACRAREKGAGQREKEAEEALCALFAESGIPDETQARSLALEVGDEKRARRECDEFFAGYAAAAAGLKEYPKGKFDGFSEEKVREAEEKKKFLSQKNGALLQEIAVRGKEAERLSGLRARYLEIEREMRGKEKERELLEKLRTLTDRGKFMAFIASEYLQEICVSASRTLLSLTGGRYFLRYDGEFRAGDNLNGGELRSVRTLSGGETFLVSLSLALALSGAICAKSLRPIEFFFLDEGFGTLDEKLVDTVMDVLEKLRSRNFSVGIISHVEELKHRIDNKIVVTGATEGQGSRVRVEAF